MSKYIPPKSVISTNIHVDIKGEYRIETISGLKPCMCHPETCNHFDGMMYFERRRKIYIEKETTDGSMG